jgi:hypothetical protein
VKVLLCLFVLCASTAFPSESPISPAEIVERALQLGVEDDLRGREYALTQESIERELSKDGEISGVKRKTVDVIPVGGQPYHWLKRRDGQPLSAEEARKERQKYEEVTERRAKETVEQRRRRLAEFEEETRRRQEMFLEIPKAFTFTLAGEGLLDGELVWFIDLNPKPGYEPKSMRTRFLAHMTGRMFVSKQDQRMMKVDVVTTGPVSLGWGMAKLSPGTRIAIEQLRLPEGFCVMKRFKMNYAVRLALVFNRRGEAEHVRWDYRRFSAVAQR